ncbi:hypothetical protein [uncultured Sphingobacterium sp.]|uniref:hypothetical protein n=1 Tax=uncultured Sphingobacterium sp. TaxID=182688 RepID=UPI0037483D32
MDLRDIELYHVFDDEMLRIEKGIISIEYLNTSKQCFFITPHNYLYEVDHLKERSKLHSLEITEDHLKALSENDYENDLQVSGNPQIFTEVFKFNDESVDFTRYKFSVKGGFLGEFLVKGDRFRIYDDQAKRIEELENIFSKQF